MSTTTELNLLPCPFCGGNPILNQIEPHSHNLMFNGQPIMPDYPGSWTIECCDVGMIKDTREEVIAAWNLRSAAHGEPSEANRIDDYARSLAMHIWREHYMKSSPEFELCEDTYGVLTQIDNMLTGLTRK